MLFILDDVFGITLWGENIFRRVLHHLSNNNYNSQKQILIHRINELLTSELTSLKQLELPNYPALNTSIIAKYEGQYSKRSTLYFNDFDKKTQAYLLSIGEKLKPTFEKTVKEELDMGDSDFKAMILRYEGKESKFNMHYDAEHEDCYRSLILYRGEGTVPPFCYVDKELVQVHLREGDGIIFKGTQTYHGVFPSGDDTTVRYVLGFQYKKKGTKEKKSLCSELRNESYSRIMVLILPYFAYYNALSYVSNVNTIVVVPSFMCIFLGYKYSMYYGTKIVHSFQSITRFYLFVYAFTFNPILSLFLVGYFILTEMLHKIYDPSDLI